MTSIYLIRHGEYENPEYVNPGRLSGFPLSKKGREQVRKLTQYFKNLKIAVLYSSPLLRTRQTAEILSEALDLPILFDDRLLEVNTMLDGESMQIFDDTEGGLSYQPDLYALGAESMEDQVSRMSEFIEEKRHQHEGKEVVVVTHGDPLRFVTMKYMGMPISFEASRSVATPLAGGYKIEFSTGMEAKVYPIVPS